MDRYCGARAAPGVAFFCLCLALWLPSQAGATDLEHQALDLDKYRGSVVVIDFWASWCVPCRRSFPWLDEMQQKYADAGLVVIGVNEDDVATDATAFLQAFPVSFRIVKDTGGQLARQFDLVAMPSTYLIDRNGEIATRHLGFKVGKTEEYEATLRQLLDITTAATGADVSTANN